MQDSQITFLIILLLLLQIKHHFIDYTFQTDAEQRRTDHRCRASTPNCLDWRQCLHSGLRHNPGSAASGPLVSRGFPASGGPKSFSFRPGCHRWQPRSRWRMLAMPHNCATSAAPARCIVPRCMPEPRVTIPACRGPCPVSSRYVQYP